MAHEYDDRMWIRLADAKVPRPVWWWVVLVLAVRHRDRKTMKAAEKIGEELADSVVKRWEHTDAATDAMLKLTRTMVRLTWAIMGLTLIVLAATLWLGLR
jgi:hypothetical protein